LERVNKILVHHKFIEYIEKIARLEEDRIYCKHEITHLIDVARISYILSLEKKTDLSKGIIYACALLHDIGRWKEYEDGIDHAIASKELAVDILQDCNFDQPEIKLICAAIGHHRIKDNHPSILSECLFHADKLSRPCFTCQSIDKCKRFSNGEIPKIIY